MSEQPSVSAAPRKRWMLPAAIAGAVFALVGVGAIAWRQLSHGHAKFPLEAARLPSTTTQLDEQELNGAHEKSDKVRQTYLAGILGSILCKPSADNPVNSLLSVGSDPTKAIAYLTPAHLAEVRSVMSCGREMAPKIASPFVATLTFTEDEQPRKLLVFTLKADQLPTKLGWIHYTFSGVPGFCFTAKGESASEADCVDASYAAVRDGERWLFTNKSAMNTLARTLARPHEQISTAVEALQEAADATQGLSSRTVQASPPSAKAFLSAPCAWASQGVAGSTSDFMAACFTATDKQLEVISTKLRAAAYERDESVEQAQAIRGRIVLVARDADAAGDMQKDVAELVRDWQSQVENNEAKLVKLASQNPTSTREKVWAATIDTFLKALKRMQVSRSGRVVTVGYDEKFSADDTKEVQEALGKPDEKPEAVVAILDAVEKQQPVPAAALGQLMGTKAAAFALDSGLGLDLATFKVRWNAWLTKANKNGKLNSLRLGDVTLAPKNGSPSESAFTVTLYHHDDPAADVTLSGVVGKDGEAIKQVTLSKTEAAKWAASATDALAFHGMVAAVTPDVDDKAVIQDLDMAPGSDTSTVRGKARFSYSSTPDGLTATYTVGLGLDAPAAAAKVGESANARSVCDNLDDWALNSLDRPFIDCDVALAAQHPGKRPCAGSLAFIITTAKAVANNASWDLTRKKAGLAGEVAGSVDQQVAFLEPTLEAIRSRAPMPGEEPIKADLIADYERLIGAYKRLAVILRQFDGNTDALLAEEARDTDKSETFDPGSSLGVLGHIKTNEVMRMSKCIALKNRVPAKSSTGAASGEDGTDAHQAVPPPEESPSGGAPATSPAAKPKRHHRGLR